MTGLIILLLLLVALYLYAKADEESCRAEAFISLSNETGDMTTSTRNYNYLDKTHRIRCAGDNTFGNQVRVVNPMDVYGRKNNSKYGFEFRFKDDQPTKAVYKTPEDAMMAYCGNNQRVLNNTD